MTRVFLRTLPVVIISALVLLSYGCRRHSHYKAVITINSQVSQPVFDYVGPIKVCWPISWTGADRLLVVKSITLHLTKWESIYGITSKPATLVFADNGEILCQYNLDEFNDLIIVDVGKYFECPDLYYLLTLHNFGIDYCKANSDDIDIITDIIVSDLIGLACETADPYTCNRGDEHGADDSSNNNTDVSADADSSSDNNDSSGNDLDSSSKGKGDRNKKDKARDHEKHSHADGSCDDKDVSALLDNRFWHGNRKCTKQVIDVLSSIDFAAVFAILEDHYKTSNDEMFDYCMKVYGRDYMVNCWWRHIKLSGDLKNKVIALLSS